MAAVVPTNILAIVAMKHMRAAKAAVAEVTVAGAVVAGVAGGRHQAANARK